MDDVVYRVGLFATLLSQKYNGKYVAVMITASHNPVQDNGVKIIEPSGEMLNVDYEEAVTNLVNCTTEQLPMLLANIKSLFRILPSDNDIQGNVMIGIDTRPSSPRLQNLCSVGVESLGGKAYLTGIVTTPELHTYIHLINQTTFSVENLPSLYIDTMVNAFYQLTKHITSKTKLTIDAANGAGAEKVKLVGEKLAGLDSFLEITVINGGDGEVNLNCGADHVKTNKKPPLNLIPDNVCTHFASLDGDADRVVYFYFDPKGRFQLMDGDRIAILIAQCLYSILNKANLDLSLGIVQTAYANGASTDYIKSLGLPVAIVSTGVKNLHCEAKKFDIGIYFEANGHGTIVFSDKARGCVELKPICQLINPVIGDAIADFLVTEAFLAIYGLSMADWQASYVDRPNILSKLEVSNPQRIKTAMADQIVVEPVGLQEAIDRTVARIPSGRAFVRPSGTEPVVRIYAEADTTPNVEELSQRICSIVNQFCEE